MRVAAGGWANALDADDAGIAPDDGDAFVSSPAQ